MSENIEPTKESEMVDKVFTTTLKLFVVAIVLALAAMQMRGIAQAEKFEEILNDCRTGNAYIVYTTNESVYYEIECKVTVFKGTPSEFYNEVE